MTLSPGARLGPYELVAFLGAGGMGEVWKARDTRLNRVVAIKRLIGQHTSRFEHEARAIAALNHPNICTLYDIGPDYLVMEYVDGTPLCGPMDAAQALQLARQLAHALEAAHQQGILHRDLKPGNVLVSHGSVKLLDFGLATMTDTDFDGTKTAESAIAGTVAYMSPEQAQGQSLDGRSDVFSLGVVLYELLSGKQAFPGHSSAQILVGLLRDEPPPLAAPESIARVVTRCLRKAPADRFQTMSEVRAALDECLAGPSDSRASIAVLPFSDMSPGKDNEYFSDGLAEEIINALTQVRGLKVIARTSAFAFKGQQTDIRRIAETLGVHHVLEGSVRKSGSRIRVTAQLIAATDGSHLWSERYDRELADVFAVQDDIAAAIATALTAQLSMGVRPSRQYTPTLPAYEAFLKARHHEWKVTPQALARSRAYFEQAIWADPQFAQAHNGLSLHYFNQAMFSLMPAHDAMPMVRSEAERALELDPSLPQAHAMLAVVASLYDYDWAESCRRFELARAAEPISPFVRNAYGLFHLMYSGHAAEAVEELRQAVHEDPLSVVMNYALAVCLLAAGRDEEGTAQLRQVLELDDALMLPVAVMAMRHAAHGNLPDAVAYAERAYALASWDPVIVGLFAGVVTRTGDRRRGLELVNELADGMAFGAPIGLAVYHLVSGEIDAAADWIEKAIDQRYPGIMFFVNLPIGQPLRDSVRWPALARLMHLP